jgi:transcriptional regulator with XRE-family HTH domain
METAIATTVDLKSLVLGYIERVGVQTASDKFGVAINTIKNWKNGHTPPSIEAAQMVLEEDGMPDQPTTDIGTNRNLYILMPAYKEMSIYTHDTLYKNYAKYGAEKIGRLTEINTLIEDARNALAHRFLTQTTAEHAIMVDDDMVLPYGNGAELNKHYGMDIPVTFGNHVGRAVFWALLRRQGPVRRGIRGRQGRP